MSSCCPPYVEDVIVTSTKFLQIYEYPRFLGGVVRIFVGNKEFVLTTSEFDGVKKFLGRDYMDATLEKFKQAMFFEAI
jgi:hypothetical protein